MSVKISARIITCIILCMIFLAYAFSIISMYQQIVDKSLDSLSIDYNITNSYTQIIIDMKKSVRSMITSLFYLIYISLSIITLAIIVTIVIKTLE